MNVAGIRQLLREGEGLEVEFKEARNKLPESLFETVCAFLNTNGGSILLGVRDSGEISGVDPESSARMKKDIANMSNNPQKIDPPFLLFPRELHMDEKIVIQIDVPSSSQVHRCKGQVYLRSEDGDYRVREPHRIAAVFNRKLGIFTEQRVYPYMDMSHLRNDLFDKARRLIKGHHPNHPWIAMDDAELLKVAGFVRDDLATGKSGYTLAALLVFGKDECIQSALPGYKFDALLCRKNPDRYDDRLTVRTNLIDAYDLLMSFAEKHLDDPFYLEKDIRVSLRSKIFREVISNIVAHREYASAAAATFKIYRDRVELRNPNNPHRYGKITPENVVPYPKNPVICKFLIQIGRFDELGSGVINVNKYLPLYAKTNPRGLLGQRPTACHRPRHFRFPILYSAY